MTEKPYLETTIIVKSWNPNFNQDATCVCGHSYYRHFDSYEDMRNVGCKYCPCSDFVEENLVVLR